MKKIRFNFLVLALLLVPFLSKGQSFNTYISYSHNSNNEYSYTINNPNFTESGFFGFNNKIRAISFNYVPKLNKSTKSLKGDIRYDENSNFAYLKYSGFLPYIRHEKETLNNKWYKDSILFAGNTFGESESEIIKTMSSYTGSSIFLNPLTARFTDIAGETENSYIVKTQDLGESKVNNIDSIGYIFELNKNLLIKETTDTISLSKMYSEEYIKTQIEEYKSKLNELKEFKITIWVDKSNLTINTLNLSLKKEEQDCPIFRVSEEEACDIKTINETINVYKRKSNAKNYILPKQNQVAYDLTKESISNSLQEKEDKLRKIRRDKNLKLYKKASAKYEFIQNKKDYADNLINLCELDNKINLKTFKDNFFFSEGPIDWKKSKVFYDNCSKPEKSFYVRLYPSNPDLKKTDCHIQITESGNPQHYPSCDVPEGDLELSFY